MWLKIDLGAKQRIGAGDKLTVIEEDIHFNWFIYVACDTNGIYVYFYIETNGMIKYFYFSSFIRFGRKKNSSIVPLPLLYSFIRAC